MTQPASGWLPPAASPAASCGTAPATPWSPCVARPSRFGKHFGLAMGCKLGTGAHADMQIPGATLRAHPRTRGGRTWRRSASQRSPSARSQPAAPRLLHAPALLAGPSAPETCCSCLHRVHHDKAGFPHRTRCTDRSRTRSRACPPAAPLTDIMVQLAPAHFDNAVACRLQQLLVMAHNNHACTHNAVAPTLPQRFPTACAHSPPSPPEEDCRNVPSHLHAARSKWFVGSSRKSTPAPLPEAEAALWPAGPSSRRASAIRICAALHLLTLSKVYSQVHHRGLVSPASLR